MPNRTADISLLFGVLGGGKVSGQSGTLIKEQLNQICGELNNAKNTNERKIKFAVDTQATTKEFRSKLASVVNTVSSTNSFRIRIDKIDASNAITKLRDEINDALKMLRIDTGFDVSVNADGSKSAVRQIAEDAEEAIKKSAQLKASIEEIKSTKKSLDKSYNTAKGILGGESATGDELTRLEEMRKAYVAMNAQLGEIEEKQKSGFIVSDDEVTKLRTLTAETQKHVDAVIGRVEAEKQAKAAAEEAAKAAEKAAKEQAAAQEAAAKAAEKAAKEKAAAEEAARKAEEKAEKERNAAEEKVNKAKEVEDLKKRKSLYKEIKAEYEKLDKAFKTAEGREGSKVAGTNEATEEFKEVCDKCKIATESVKNFKLEVKSIPDAELPKMDALEDSKKSIDDAKESVKKFNETLIPRSTEYNAALSKTESLLGDIEKGENNWTKAKNGSSANDYNKLKDYKKALEDLKTELEGGNLSAEEFSKRFDNLNSQFKASSSAIKAAGENTKTLGERFGDLAEKFSKWLTVSQVIMFVVRQIRKMITTVIELDDAMTELKKVTDETDGAYEKFFDNASKRAKELGATLKDTINATASFARLGYDIADASALADAAVIYNNVGDEIESIDDASQSIISTMQAFGVETQNVMTIVDKFNAVGNSFSISSGGIGEALKRSASALHTAGNTLDESIALITAANTIVQDPDSVGTVMKSITMFLRAAKTEAEEAGESTDGMANSVSELREELSKLTGGKVDIMEADGKTFKSTYDILKQISSVWEELSDVTQANILELIGGKRNSNVTSALLTNFELAEKVVETSANSAGSALAENEKVLESITGHINRMKAAFEELSASVVDSDLLKFVIDVGTELINIINALFELINVIGGLKTVAIGGGIYAVVSSLKNILDAINLIKAGSLQTAGAISGLSGFMTALGTTGSYALTVLTGVAAALGAIVLAVKAYQHFNPSFDALKEDAEAAQQELSSLESQLRTTQDRIKELQELAANGEISIVEKDELENLERENELLESQIALKKELAELNAGRTAAKAREEIEYLINGADEQSSLDSVLAMYKETKEAYEQAILDGDAQEAERLGGDLQAILEGLTARQSAIVDMYTSLDPETDSELIRQANLALDKISVATGDAQALQTIWDKVWGSDSPVKGAKETADALTEAANAQQKVNEEVEKFNGNVDLTNRPILLRKDFEGKDSLDYDDKTRMVTINTRTFKASDWDDYASSTSAILVTPILPNGEVLSQDELDAYVASLIDPKTGEFDASRDTEYGIVIGVANEGDAEKNIELLDDLAQKAHEANEEFASLYLSDEVQEVLSYLSELGYNLEDMTAGELADMFEQVTSIVSAAEDADTMFKNLYSTVSALSEKKGLLNDLATDMADGSITDSTLNSLHEQYSALDGIITQYRLGLATATDVYNEYKRLYEQDEKNLLRSTRWKIGLSEDYFNENIKGNAEMVKILGSYYTTDYENYKELAREKEKIDNTLISILGEKWADYYGTYSEAVDKIVASSAGTSLGNIHATDAYLASLRDAAIKMDGISAKFNESILELRLPESSSSSSKVEEYIADIDKYREAIERLNQAKLSVDSLDSKLELSDDAREQIQLRSQMLDLYADEMDAQETLNKLRREGIEEGAEKLRGMGFDVAYDPEKDSFLIKNLEHINELEAKTKDTHKSLQEATNELRKDTEEYIEKLEELNEDNQDGEENWRSLKKSIHDAKTTIVDDLKSIATSASEALDSIQNVYDTLRSAADEYASSNGFLTIDTYQSLLELGPQYMQYLKDESGKLVITREKIEELIAAKVQQLSLDNAMTYVERLRLALQEDSVEELNDLLYATTEATSATWGFVYANLALLDLSDEQRAAALHNIDTMRALADNVGSNIARIYNESSLEDLIEYTTDMLRDKINEQKDALEDMKDAYKELIDLKKESLDAAKDEADHQKDMASKLKEIAKLQARIDILSLDSSREAQAERTSLLEQMAELQDELSDSQRDYAIDQQKEALDKMQEDYEAQKDDEIKALEDSISSEEKLYRKAVQHIKENWSTLYDELLDWNTEMGSVINSKITQAWKDAQAAVEAYGGSVEKALKAAESGDSSSSNDVVGTTGGYSHNTTIEDKVNAKTTRMKENSAAWHNASTQSKKDALNAENAAFAKEIGALLGKSIVIDQNGVWRIGSTTGPKLYDVYPGTYHTGGIVGEKGSLKSNELLAKLEKGEAVIPKEDTENLIKLLRLIADADKVIDTSRIPNLAMQGNMDAIRSLTNVTNNRAGDIRFGDVYIYGAGSDTVAKHREINREFTNEVLKQLNIKR